jgi:hypothetical protein
MIFDTIIIMGLLNNHYCGIIMGLLLCTMINLDGGLEHFWFSIDWE